MHIEKNMVENQRQDFSKFGLKERIWFWIALCSSHLTRNNSCSKIKDDTKQVGRLEWDVLIKISQVPNTEFRWFAINGFLSEKENFSLVWIVKKRSLNWHEYSFKILYRCPAFNYILREKGESHRGHKQLLKCPTVECVLLLRNESYIMCYLFICCMSLPAVKTCQMPLFCEFYSFSIANLLLTVIRTWWRGLCRWYMIVSASVM